MFDIGFSELVLVFIVGLVVLGPQRLPVAIRTVVGWIRTIRGMASNVQSELSQELKLHELQESIKKAEQLNLGELSPDLAKNIEDLKVSATEMQQQLKKQGDSINNTINERIKEVEEELLEDEKAELVESDDPNIVVEEENTVKTEDVEVHLRCYQGEDIPAEAEEYTSPTKQVASHKQID